MAILWWTLTLALMFAGLAGIFVPVFPDTVLIFAGAVLHYVLLGPEKSVGTGTLIGLGALMVFTQGIDLVSGSIGAKWFGATRWGAFGGIAGALVGMFFFPWGLFLGPMAGVLLGELLGGKGILPAGRSAWGTLLGTAAGMIVKLGVALTMIVWFLIAAVF